MARPRSKLLFCVLLLGNAGWKQAGAGPAAKSYAALWPGLEPTQKQEDARKKDASKGGGGKSTFSSCQKAKLLEVSRHFNKKLKMPPFLALVCEHTTTAPARVEAKLRWEQASPALREAETQLRKRVAADVLPFRLQDSEERSGAWLSFVNWLMELALESDMHEVRALGGIVQEALLWETLALRSDGLQLGQLLQNVWGVIDEYCRAGRFEDARRAFGAQLALEWPTPGRFPIGYFFDTKDYRMVSQGPEPGLRVLPAPIALDDPSAELLPASLVQRLRADWHLLAEEAKGATKLLGRGDKQGGDAYPTIATGGQWTKLDVYDVTGWREDLCKKKLPRLCAMLKGTLRSESAQGQEWAAKRVIGANDETVGLFGVRPGGWASLHSGQDRRVNVHLCLANCNSSRVVVAGTNIPYHDGSLFAFEDRAQHEVLNEGAPGDGDRINLVIGILHPDFDPDKEPKRRGQSKRLDWWLEQLKDGLAPKPQYLQQIFFEVLHAQDVPALKFLTTKGFTAGGYPQQGFNPLLESAAVGHTHIAKALLELRASPRASNDGVTPLHYAAHGGHVAMTKFLMANGAESAAAPGMQSPLDLARSQGHAAVAGLLSRRGQQKPKRQGEL